MSVKFTANFIASAQTNFKFVLQDLCLAPKAPLNARNLIYLIAC